MTLPRLVLLVVDDSGATARLLRREMAPEGLRILAAVGSDDGLNKLAEADPDAALVASDLPDLSDFLLMARRMSHIPIIVIARPFNWQRAVIDALSLGADAFLHTPMDIDVLLALVDAQLRRAGSLPPTAQSVLHLGQLTMDFARHAVFNGSGEVLPLSRMEWALLSYFILHRGYVVTYSEILSHIWGPEYRDEHHLVHDWISRLRRKLKAAGLNEEVIDNFPGVGYMLRLPPDRVANPTGLEDADAQWQQRLKKALDSYPLVKFRASSHAGQEVG